MDVRKESVEMKPAFEPSKLVEYGEASDLTRGPTGASQPVDGDYTS